MAIIEEPFEASTSLLCRPLPLASSLTDGPGVCCGNPDPGRCKTTCIRLLFRTDTNDLTGGVRRGKGAMVISHASFVLKEGPAGVGELPARSAGLRCKSCQVRDSQPFRG